MQLTPFRWLLIAVIIGGGGAIVAAPSVVISDGRDVRYVDFVSRGGLDLDRRAHRAAAALNRASADWIFEYAAPVAAQVKPGAPLLPSRAAFDEGTATPDTLGWSRLMATRDSIEALRVRFAKGSLGDIGVGVRNIGTVPPAGLTSFDASAVLPERLNGSACVVVSDAKELHRLALRGTIFGPCYWYGAFGMPGRGVREWLGGTHHTGTSETNGRRRSELLALRAQSRTLASLPRSFAEAVMLTGAPLSVAVCVARGGDACGKLETDPKLWQWTRFGGSLGNRYGVVSMQSSLMIDMNRGPGELYSEFGAERFARLWRSPLPFPEAFEEAMGVPLNDYMRRAAIQDFGGTYHPGPQVDGSTLLLLMMAIGGLFVVMLLPGARPTAS